MHPLWENCRYAQTRYFTSEVPQVIHRSGGNACEEILSPQAFKNWIYKLPKKDGAPKSAGPRYLMYSRSWINASWGDRDALRQTVRLSELLSAWTSKTSSKIACWSSIYRQAPKEEASAAFDPLWPVIDGECNLSYEKLCSGQIQRQWITTRRRPKSPLQRIHLELQVSLRWLARCKAQNAQCETFVQTALKILYYTLGNANSLKRNRFVKIHQDQRLLNGLFLWSRCFRPFCPRWRSQSPWNWLSQPRPRWWWCRPGRFFCRSPRRTTSRWCSSPGVVVHCVPLQWTPDQFEPMADAHSENLQVDQAPKSKPAATFHFLNDVPGGGPTGSGGLSTVEPSVGVSSSDLRPLSLLATWLGLLGLPPRAPLGRFGGIKVAAIAAMRWRKQARSRQQLKKKPLR